MIESMMRSSFLALSRNGSLRRLSEGSALGQRVSSRFVAGLDHGEVLRVTESLNKAGLSATLDSLGENVETPDEAKRAADVYHRLLEAIAARGLDANCSVKLTQMGMDLDPALAENIVAELAKHAEQAKLFLRVDMEGSPYTEATLGLVERVHARHPGFVGAVIQAYLYRSEQDIARLLRSRIRVRLCKGAYQEPASIAFPEKGDVDRNYVSLMKTLLTSGVYHGIATHDEAMIAATQAWMREQGISPDQFEFQMLYGVRRDLQTQLVAQGYRVRVYVPFGTEWYPYFMRRLAERPANVLFLAKNIFRA